MKTLVEMGRLVPAVEYAKAMHGLDGDVRAARSRSSTTTTCSCRPRSRCRRRRSGAWRGAGFEDMLRFLALTPFTALWNTTGQPAVSLPLADDEDGLPVGVQLVARPAAEATLLQVCAQVEAARPWRDRRPPVS